MALANIAVAFAVAVSSETKSEDGYMTVLVDSSEPKVMVQVASDNKRRGQG